MKPIIRNLLFIIVVLQFLVVTGCSSYWAGFAAVLQVAYGVTTAVTDHDVHPACDAPDIVIIPWPLDPELGTDCDPESDSDCDDPHDAGTEYDYPEQNVKPVQDTHRENVTEQSDTARRPFTRR